MKCIVHIPFSINEKYGSHIRPPKMIEGFKKIGYTVEVVSGESDQRASQIKRIKRNIREGVVYDFLYSESSTMPTILTDRSHIPKRGFMDFLFLKHLSNKNIPIGFFYRDVYWKFPVYNESVRIPIRWVMKGIYRLELYLYRKISSVVFLPSLKMKQYVEKIEKPLSKVYALPPGTIEDNIKQITRSKAANEVIRFVYVGGISKDLYNLELFFKAISQLDSKVNFNVICRENEWNSQKENYSKYLSENIEISHLSGKEMIQRLRNADIGVLFFKPDTYRDFAMPIKLFEYLENGLPIIANMNTSAGEFVRENGVGVVAEYSERSLMDAIESLFNDHFMEKIKKNTYNVAMKNTWKDRAKFVAEKLATNLDSRLD